MSIKAHKIPGSMVAKLGVGQTRCGVRSVLGYIRVRVRVRVRVTGSGRVRVRIQVRI